jgi:hypothetical protein
MIAESFGMAITAVFDTYGEAEFRKREAEIVAGLPQDRASSSQAAAWCCGRRMSTRCVGSARW